MFLYIEKRIDGIRLRTLRWDYPTDPFTMMRIFIRNTKRRRPRCEDRDGSGGSWVKEARSGSTQTVSTRTLGGLVSSHLSSVSEERLPLFSAVPSVTFVRAAGVNAQRWLPSFRKRGSKIIYSPLNGGSYSFSIFTHLSFNLVSGYWTWPLFSHSRIDGMTNLMGCTDILISFSKTWPWK